MGRCKIFGSHRTRRFGITSRQLTRRKRAREQTNTFENNYKIYKGRAKQKIKEKKWQEKNGKENNTKEQKRMEKKSIKKKRIKKNRIEKGKKTLKKERKTRKTRKKITTEHTYANRHTVTRMPLNISYINT